MEQVTTSSFTANADTPADMLNLLIYTAGYKDRTDFATYMGVDIADLSETPTWAINYLKDVIDANLTHLGYVMKDTKHEGIIGEYNEAVKQLEEQSLTGDTIQTPIVIDESIIATNGTIKISYLSRMTNAIKDVTP